MSSHGQAGQEGEEEAVGEHHLAQVPAIYRHFKNWDILSIYNFFFSVHFLDLSFGYVAVHSVFLHGLIYEYEIFHFIDDILEYHKYIQPYY